jgi:O-antigen/teichoic acid export membrane protein
LKIKNNTIEKEIKELYREDISKLARNAGITGVGEIAGNIITYASNVLVTRRIGPTSFGIYVLATTIFRIVGIFSVAGLDNGLIRFISLYQGRGDKARVKGVILFATKVAGLLSLFFFPLLFLTAPFTSTRIFHNPDLSPALQIILISLPFTTLMTIWLGGIQGFQLIKYRVYVEKLFQPFSRLFFLIILFILGMKLFGVLIATVLSAVIGFIMSFWYLNKIFPFRKDQLSPVYEKKKLITFSMPVTFVTFFFFITRWISILMLGYFVTPRDVGIFGAVDRVLPLVGLPLESLNIIFSPMISGLYGERALSKLENLFKVETKWAVSLSFPICLTLIIFARPIMRIFGAAFTEGSVVLIILSIAQLIRVSVGSTGPMLMMTGHQNISLFNTFFTAVITITLNYFLIPQYGILGAAIANFISVVVINTVEVIQIYYLFKMHPFRMDFLKPLAAGIFTSLIILLVLQSDFIKLNQYNIFFLGILCLLFFAVYFLWIIVLRLSQEDKLIIKLLFQKLGIVKQ